MPHPFAAPLLARRRSLFNLRPRPATPDAAPPPLPDAKHPSAHSPPPVPPLPTWLDLAPNRDLPALQPTKSNTSSHYIKHSSKLTLLLSGQREGVAVPQYSNADTIEGILAIARPSGVLALEVKIEGSISIHEIGGSASVNVKTIDECIYAWNAVMNASFPPKASFRYTLPSTYRDPATEKDYPLPPTYSADLHGIPAFSVKTAYAVVVNLTLSRDASTLWRGVSNVRVPFRYLHRTRPSLAGPFPCNALNSPSRPRTLYTFQMRSWRVDAPDIKVQLYLPSSAVCCYQDAIPFHVTIFADEQTLEHFAEYRPTPSSFLPLASHSNPSTETLRQQQLASFKGAPKCPLRIKVLRTTTVDTASVACGLFSALAVRQKGADAVRHLFKHENARAPGAGGDDHHMDTTRTMGYGEVHSATRGVDSVVWTGSIAILQGKGRFTGAFDVHGLKVVDSLAFSIEPPAACRSRYLPLHESVSLHLASDPYTSRKGDPVSSVA